VNDVSLTTKQEKFVQGLISGLSQREAYKRSYDCSNMKDSTIDVKASQLYSNGKIRIRYDELITEHKSKALWTREESVSDLKWLKEQAKSSIIEIGVRQANTNAMLNAIKELNELEDLYTKTVDDEQYEDDGFLEALDGKEVDWDEEA
jgi:phage terminase small subunit